MLTCLVFKFQILFDENIQTFAAFILNNYRGSVFAEAAQGSNPTCGHFLRVIPPLSLSPLSCHSWVAATLQ